MTEGVLLVAVAVALGMPAASATIPRLFSLIPERRLRGMPYFRDAGLHPNALLFAAAVPLEPMTCAPANTVPPLARPNTSCAPPKMCAPSSAARGERADRRVVVWRGGRSDGSAVSNATLR